LIGTFAKPMKADDIALSFHISERCSHSLEMSAFGAFQPIMARSSFGRSCPYPAIPGR
jgi:hypothetical protein